MQKSIEEQKLDAWKLARRLLDPEDLGLAATPEIRDAAREVMGLGRVETKGERDDRKAIQDQIQDCPIAWEPAKQDSPYEHYQQHAGQLAV